MTTYFGPPGGGTGGDPAPLPLDEAIVKNGDSVLIVDASDPPDGALASFVIANNNLENMALQPTVALAKTGDVSILPASGTSPAQGKAHRTVAMGAEVFRLGATRAAVDSGKTVVLRDGNGGAIGNGELTISNNNLTGVKVAAVEAILTNGQTKTASTGQQIQVSVVNNAPTLTVKNWAFWDPFTVDAAEQADGSFGFLIGATGNFTNEPIVGYSLLRATVNADGDFELSISGPKGIAVELEGAFVGIDGVTYAPETLETQTSGVGLWTSKLLVSGVPAWTDGQQVPIVIIPQNGG